MTHWSASGSSASIVDFNLILFTSFIRDDKIFAEFCLLSHLLQKCLCVSLVCCRGGAQLVCWSWWEYSSGKPAYEVGVIM